MKLCRPIRSAARRYPRVLTLVALLLAPTVWGTARAESAAAPATSSYQWQATQDSLTLLKAGQVIYTFHYAPADGYPYFHPLSLAAGPLLSAFAPPDHPWHRGLWFSWKFLNGVNYWEFPPGRPNQPDGRTAVVNLVQLTTNAASATLVLRLEYSKTNTVLSEERTLTLLRPRPDGSYTVDWTSRFTAGDRDVVLERTPPQEASWGGYGGLGFRASASMRDFRAIDSEGRVGKAEAHGKPARWMDFSGAFGTSGEKTVPAGLAILDHPSNVRYPTRWYLSDNAELPYFGPALLFAEPLTLKAGESLTLRYRVLVHPGFGDKNALEKEYRDFVK